MNHLGVDGNIRVIFDSGDSNEGTDCDDEEPVDLVDLADIRREFLPALDELDDLAISHSLEGFSFDKDLAATYDATYLNETFRANDAGDDDDDDGFGEATFRLDDGAAPMDIGGDGEAAAPVEDFFSGDQAVPDFEDFAPPMDDGSFDAEHSGEGDGTAAASASNAQSGYQALDPRRIPNERDFTMALTEGDDGTMDYFDSGFLKNWAGPEHWKVRRVFRRREFTVPLLSPLRQLRSSCSGYVYRQVCRGQAEEGEEGLQNRLFSTSGKDCERAVCACHSRSRHHTRRVGATVVLAAAYEGQEEGRHPCARHP